MVTDIILAHDNNLSLASLVKKGPKHKVVFILLWKISIFKHNMTVCFPLRVKTINFRSCQSFLPEMPARWGHLLCWPQLLLSLLCGLVKLQKPPVFFFQLLLVIHFYTHPNLPENWTFPGMEKPKLYSWNFKETLN